MPKNIFTFMIAVLAALLVTFASAQDKKPDGPPKPAQSQSQELLWMWNSVGNKLIAMAEDFPEDKYSFKAQKDERTFGENLIHVAWNYNGLISVIKGSTMESILSKDSLRKKYPTKTDIVKLLKQAVADGAQLIKEQGDSGLTREYKSQWANMMFHSLFGWLTVIEHAGEHYGQLAVYYRLNGMVPPQSRPKK
jgi:uncharacterized damage-inducible protein DinB